MGAVTPYHDWHAKMFKDAAFWRAEAARWERLAEMATADGDTRHAENHRREAAGCRENARQWEIAHDR